MRIFSALSKYTLMIVLIIIASVYFFSLPHFVQGGDTAELVNAAKNLFTAHPPGYPLWIFSEWIWLNTIRLQNVFWQASLLNTFFSFCTLFLVLRPLKDKPFFLILTAISLGFSTAFFEASILPDVFAMHALIIALISYLFLFSDKSSPRRQALIPFFFLLGMAHHHTIIFLAPLVAFTLYESLNNKDLRLSFFKGAVAGSIAVILLYVCLLFLNSSSYYSWGNITSIKDVLSHFLRSDYGTFSFSPVDNSGISKLDSLLYLLKSTFLELSALAVVFIALVFLEAKKFLNLKFAVWILTLLFSLSFFLMTNFKMEGMGLEIISRFHVMPSVLLAMTAAYVFTKTEKNQISTILSLVAILAVAPMALKNVKSILPLQNDSVFEDYSSTLLKTAISKKANIILIDNDNTFFAIKYLQNSNPDYKDIVVISPRLLFHEWYFEKIKTQYPQFTLLNKDQVWLSKNMDLSRDLIEPNLTTTNILITKPLKSSTKFKSTQLTLGILLTSGAGNALEDNRTGMTTPSLPKATPQLFSKKTIFSEYAFYYLSTGRNFYQNQKPQEAILAWKKALEIVPYAAPALMNICAIDAKAADCSEENISQIKNESFLIF